jgi:hypothetical protein
MTVLRFASSALKPLLIIDTNMKLSLLLWLLPAMTLALPAPVIPPRAGSPIPGRYVVKIQRHNYAAILKAARNMLKQDPIHVYDFGNFGGFTADMTDDMVERIRRLPGVGS